MWIKTRPKKNTTEMLDLGMAIEHSVKCWLCDNESAVYSAYPNFCFFPCWSCQKQYWGLWKEIQKKKWYEFWK